MSKLAQSVSAQIRRCDVRNRRVLRTRSLGDQSWVRRTALDPQLSSPSFIIAVQQFRCRDTARSGSKCQLQARLPSLPRPKSRTNPISATPPVGESTREYARDRSGAEACMWKYLEVLAFLVSWLLLCGVPSLLASQIEPAQVAKEETSEGKPMTRHQCWGLRKPAPCHTMIGQAVAVDTPVTIISDHIRRQGYPCDEPRHAEHDQQASRPNEAVWFLRCKDVSYRVTLIPDMAARVEVVK